MGLRAVLGTSSSSTTMSLSPVPLSPADLPVVLYAVLARQQQERAELGDLGARDDGAEVDAACVVTARRERPAAPDLVAARRLPAFPVGSGRRRMYPRGIPPTGPPGRGRRRAPAATGGHRLRPPPTRRRVFARGQRQRSRRSSTIDLLLPPSLAAARPQVSPLSRRSQTASGTRSQQVSPSPSRGEPGGDPLRLCDEAHEDARTEGAERPAIPRAAALICTAVPTFQQDLELCVQGLNLYVQDPGESSNGTQGSATWRPFVQGTELRQFWNGRRISGRTGSAGGLCSQMLCESCVATCHAPSSTTEGPPVPYSISNPDGGDAERRHRVIAWRPSDTGSRRPCPLTMSRAAPTSSSERTSSTRWRSPDHPGQLALPTVARRRGLDSGRSAARAQASTEPHRPVPRRRRCRRTSSQGLGRRDDDPGLAAGYEAGHGRLGINADPVRPRPRRPADR